MDYGATEVDDSPGAAALVHDAMFYAGDQQFASTLVPFIHEGLRAGDAIVAAVTRANIAVLRDALGTDAAAVTFIDRDDWYVRPTTTVAGWERMVTDATGRGHPRVRVIGEVSFGLAPRQAGWSRYEAVLNEVFADAPAWIVCPYDVRALPAELVSDARRTHPTVFTPGRPASTGYLSPAEFLSLVPEPMPEVSGPPVLAMEITDGVAPARHALSALLAAHGWAGSERGDDLLLVMSEIVTNSVRHGRGPRCLRAWIDGDRVVCEVTDNGDGPADLLTGYRPPSRAVTGGRGLWITRQLCDAFAVAHRDGITIARMALTLT